ncbi:hypothetical protein [Streptomyces sp. NPDC089919]|uniref:hypothetical protein n=1 Tax=Streptomyces sp. NPDC089919 TaxID=3155188 RepID=UPI0034466585
MDESRSQPLEGLVRWRGALGELIANTRRSASTWSVTFSRAHAVAALEKVAAGTARPAELVDWAQAVHFHDQVDIEEGHHDLLTRFLVEISTPELFEPVTPDVYRRWLHLLRESIASAPKSC